MMKIENFKINAQKNLLFLELPLEFCWSLTDCAPDTVQTAWQIQLQKHCSGDTATSVCTGNISACICVWDSGKVLSSECAGILYTGPALSPLTEYSVCLTVWVSSGEHAAAALTFISGRGTLPWISSWMEPRQTPVIPDISATYFAPYVMDYSDRAYKNLPPAQFIRCPLKIKKKVHKAYLFASSHGIYALYLNGTKIGNQEFAPDFSPYERMLMYQTHEISGQLTPGTHIVSMILASGWWCGHIGLSGDNCQYGDRLAALLECRVFYTDGTSEIFDFTDAKSHEGNIRYADLFIGEYCDAAAEPGDWMLPSFTDLGWIPLQPVFYPMDSLHPQEYTGVEIIQKFTPKALFSSANETWILDIGQNIAGYMEISLLTNAGHEIVLEHSEMLDENAHFMYCIKGRNKDQRDVYITKNGMQTWHPLFTYHGFRYVRITGWPGTPQLSQFRACVLSTPIERTGNFHCSNEALNQLHENIWWSQLANTISIPTDCPQREKAGWTGDAMIYSETMCTLSDAESFLRRWLHYCRTEQMEDGVIPMVVPYMKQYRKFATKVGSHTSSGWGDAIVIVPWNLYQYTGNLQILRENYVSMKAWCDYWESQTRNYRLSERKRFLRNTGFHFGDWLLPSIMRQENAVPMDTSIATGEIFSSAYYAYIIQLMAKTASLLDENDTAEYYAQLHKNICDAFAKEYIHPNGTLTVEYQGAYVVSLKFGLIPPFCRTAAVKHLCEMIRQNQYCLDTGFLSVPFLLDVLSETGHEEIAYRLLFQTKCPGWLYMIKNHATTIWEFWDCIHPNGSIGSYSYNHYAFGCVGKWLYSHLAGIRLIEPGYKKTAIIPGIRSGLSFVNASVQTPYGTLKVTWEITNERKLRLDLEIPVGITAEIQMKTYTTTVSHGTWQFYDILPVDGR